MTYVEFVQLRTVVVFMKVAPVAFVPFEPAMNVNVLGIVMFT